MGKKKLIGSGCWGYVIGIEFWLFNPKSDGLDKVAAKWKMENAQVLTRLL